MERPQAGSRSGSGFDRDKSNSSSSSPISVVSAFWKDFEMEKEKSVLDEQGLRIAENQENSQKNRRRLAENTRDFKKASPEDKLSLFNSLLKGYQEEVDNLTKRAKFGENAFLNIYQKLYEAPDPYPALASIAEQDLKLSELESENRKMKVELEEFRTEATHLKNQQATIRRLEERLLMCWWAFTGLTHIILEGYFVFSPEFFKDKTGFYLAEVWQEYSKGDSRYAGRDAGVVAVEGITTVLDGPASLLAVYAIATGKSYRYILQFAVSLAQLYGTIVYFVTAILQGDNFSVNTFYYYGYYFGTNGWWVLIPLLIMKRCWRNICATVEVQSQTRKTKVR